jgi:hypothetical protein
MLSVIRLLSPTQDLVLRNAVKISKSGVGLRGTRADWQQPLVDLQSRRDGLAVEHSLVIGWTGHNNRSVTDT